MTENLKLLMAIREKGLTQKQFAKLVGDPETSISRVVRGYFNLDDQRKRRYAEALGKRVADIFQN